MEERLSFIPPVDVVCMLKRQDFVPPQTSECIDEDHVSARAADIFARIDQPPLRALEEQPVSVLSFADWVPLNGDSLRGRFCLSKDTPTCRPSSQSLRPSLACYFAMLRRCLDTHLNPLPDGESCEESLFRRVAGAPPLRQDLAPVLGGDELRKMFGIASGNHHVRWCGSKRERLGGEDYIDVEIFGIGCRAPLLSRLCPKLCG